MPYGRLIEASLPRESVELRGPLYHVPDQISGSTERRLSVADCGIAQLTVNDGCGDAGPR
jgi:hypothetical protein